MPAIIVVLAITLLATAPATAAPLPSGLYEPSAGRRVGITTFSDGRTIFTDFASGWTGRLTPSGKDRFVARRANGDSIVARFLRRGEKGPDLFWSEPGRPTTRLSRLVFRREEVRFSNGDVSLGGTLVLPHGRGPFPLVIRLHGAGPADRVNAIDEYFADHGVAFFSYDERGVADSTGSWRRAGVEDLAGDAIAAFGVLAKHPQIDAGRIGVGAGSEGGWVAASVADQVPALAFVFLLAGPALSFFDEVVEEARAGLRERGIVEPDLGRALAFTRFQMGLIASGSVLEDLGWRALQARVDSERGEPWFAGVEPWPRASWRWEKFHRMAAFDPDSLWSRYRRPLLAVYGGRDLDVPASPNVAALERAMRLAGNADATIEVVAAADHEGLDAGTRDGDLVRFAPGYLDRPVRWVLERVRRN